MIWLCNLFHKWGKWEPTTIIIQPSRTDWSWVTCSAEITPATQVEGQTRTCKRCGYEQIREVGA